MKMNEAKNKQEPISSYFSETTEKNPTKNGIEKVYIEPFRL